MGWPKLTKNSRESSKDRESSKGPQVPPLPPDLAKEAADSANSANGPPRKLHNQYKANQLILSTQQLHIYHAH